MILSAVPNIPIPTINHAIVTDNILNGKSANVFFLVVVDLDSRRVKT